MLLLGVEVGSGADSLKFFASTPSDCRNTLFLSIKIYFILDGIGYLLQDIIH